VVLNDQLVGGDADVKGVLFGPSDTLEPALLGTAKVDEDLEAGLEKTQVKKKKTSQVGFLVFFGVFWVFWGFLYICPEEGVFRVFSVSRILLGVSRL
jgi:hypothetical protein